jgi:hypothetical protein
LQLIILKATLHAKLNAKNVYLSYPFLQLKSAVNSKGVLAANNTFSSYPHLQLKCLQLKSSPFLPANNTFLSYSHLQLILRPNFAVNFTYQSARNNNINV